MPIYEFRCKDCGCEFEEFFLTFELVKLGDVKCPSCQSQNVEKLFSPPLVWSGKFTTPRKELIARDEEMDYYEKRKDYDRAAKAAEKVGKKEDVIKHLYRKTGKSAK